MSLPDPGPWKGFDLHKKHQDKLFLNQLVQIIQFVLMVLGSPASLAQYIKIYFTFTNVLVYGADPTGTKDSTTAINNAISGMPAGGTLYFPAGTYLISGTITLNKNGRYLGDGPGCTIIQTNSATASMFNMTVGATGNVVIEGFQFQSSVTRTAGYYIDCTVSGGGGYKILNFQMNSPFNGILVNGWNGLIQDGVIFNVPSAGVGIQVNVGSQPTISRTFIDGLSSLGTGINVTGCSGLLISQCNCSKLNIGIALTATTNAIDGAYITDTYCDQPTASGIVISSSLAAAFVDCKIDGLFTSFPGSYGISITTTGTGLISYVMIAKSNINNGSASGILVQGTTSNIQICNNKIFSNSGSGIFFGNNVNGVIITNNSIVTNGVWGISYGTGMSGLMIAGNDLRGNTSGEEGGAPAAAAGNIIRGAAFVGYNI